VPAGEIVTARKTGNAVHTRWPTARQTPAVARDIFNNHLPRADDAAGASRERRR
jgi:hypothetical protein